METPTAHSERRVTDNSRTANRHFGATGLTRRIASEHPTEAEAQTWVDRKLRKRLHGQPRWTWGKVHAPEGRRTYWIAECVCKAETARAIVEARS